jgi:prolyl-tRNA synthetase
VHFPALMPRDPYEATGRWEEYGDGIFRLKDRKGADYLLAPTHEEAFTLLVKDLYGSYKDLPLTIYQIQDKYRDEARPRAGLLRGREFTMKDAYSFDYTDAGLDTSYMAQRDAYERIFQRLGLEYVIVQADAGAMGGSRSEVPAPDGDRRGHVRALGGRLRRQRGGVRDPGARAHRVRRVRRAGDLRLPEHAHDRDARGAHQRRARRRVHRRRHPQERRPRAHTPRRQPRARRRRSPRRSRRRRQARRGGVRAAEVEPATPEDFEKHPLLVKGYIGPWSPQGAILGEESATGIRYVLDPRVVDGTRWITGANIDQKHVHSLVAGRDFAADGYVEVATVRPGDPAPDGSGPVELARGMEIGHVFQLGRKYADAGAEGARRERQARHRHDGLLRHRRHADPRDHRRAEQRRQGSHLARVGRAVRRAGRRHGARCRGLRAREKLSADLDGPGWTCSTTTAPRSPRV